MVDQTDILGNIAENVNPVILDIVWDALLLFLREMRSTHQRALTNKFDILNELLVNTVFRDESVDGVEVHLQRLYLNFELLRHELPV